MNAHNFCDYCDDHFGIGNSRQITWRYKEDSESIHTCHIEGFSATENNTGYACDCCYEYFTEEATDLIIIKK